MTTQRVFAHDVPSTTAPDARPKGRTVGDILREQRILGADGKLYKNFKELEEAQAGTSAAADASVLGPIERVGDDRVQAETQSIEQAGGTAERL